MMEWDVTFELASDDGVELEELADELVELLSYADGVVSIVNSLLVVSVTVEVPDFTSAVSDSLERVRDALSKLDLSIGPERIVGLRAKPSLFVAAAIDSPTFPEMMGVSEVAELLSVSKQRVTELRGSGKLPSPIADLRAGPVWPRPAIERWLEGWDRKPGRPKKQLQGVRRKVQEAGLDADVVDEAIRAVREA